MISETPKILTTDGKPKNCEKTFGLTIKDGNGNTDPRIIQTTLLPHSRAPIQQYRFIIDQKSENNGEMILCPNLDLIEHKSYKINGNITTFFGSDLVKHAMYHEFIIVVTNNKIIRQNVRLVENNDFKSVFPEIEFLIIFSVNQNKNLEIKVVQDTNNKFGLSSILDIEFISSNFNI